MTVIGGIAILVCMLLLPFNGQTEEGEAVTLVAKPEPQVIFSGEPCEIELTFHNVGVSDLEVNIGYVDIGAYWFEILDDLGDTVCESSATLRSGSSRFGQKVVGAEDSLSHRLILNKRCSTLLPPGQYNVITHVAQPTFELENSATLTIAEPEERRLKQIFSQLTARALDDDSLGNWSFAADMLTSTDSPYAVDAIARLLYGSWFPDNKVSALEAFNRIGTVEAILQIAKAADYPGDEYVPVRQIAVKLLREAYETNANPTIRRICKPFVSPLNDRK